jgi:peptidoglycan biosynthesis protein MviN/MurJ (putative lipid II flippase)
MLAMAIVTCTLMLDGVRAGRSDVPTAARPRPQIRLAGLARSVGLVLGSTMVYLAFNGLYVITLAFTSNYDAGDATVLSYAYLFASYLVAATGFALGMSRIADMRRGALADWREVIADTVPAGFRYSMLLVAPALAALIAGGATLIGEVLPSSFDAAQVDQLRVFTALLCAWTVAALLVNLLLPALFALGRAKIVNLLAIPVVVAHIAVTALGGALFGANGVVGAFFVVPLAFAIVLLALGAGRNGVPIGRELARDGVRFLLISAAGFGIGDAIASSLTSGIATPLLTIAIGSLLYGISALRLAPGQMRLLMGAVRPASA